MFVSRARTHVRRGNGCLFGAAPQQRRPHRSLYEWSAATRCHVTAADCLLCPSGEVPLLPHTIVFPCSALPLHPLPLCSPRPPFAWSNRRLLVLKRKAHQSREVLFLHPPEPPELSRNVPRAACGSVGPCSIRSCLSLADASGKSVPHPRAAHTSTAGGSQGGQARHTGAPSWQCALSLCSAHGSQLLFFLSLLGNMYRSSILSGTAGGSVTLHPFQRGHLKKLLEALYFDRMRFFIRAACASWLWSVRHAALQTLCVQRFPAPHPRGGWTGAGWGGLHVSTLLFCLKIFLHLGRAVRPSSTERASAMMACVPSPCPTIYAAPCWGAPRMASMHLAPPPPY